MTPSVLPPDPRAARRHDRDALSPPLVAAAALVLLASLGARSSIAHADDTPWTQRPSCQAAFDASIAFDTAVAEARLKALEGSRDPDDVACALWVRASIVELQLGFYGRSPELEGQRKKALSRLAGFARAHKADGPRFADLELEARLRRIRVLSDDGQRSQLVSELRELVGLLDARGLEPMTPTLHYTIGVMHAALSSPGWAARAALSVMGITVEPEIAARHLHPLADGDSVYRGDALYLSQFFAEAMGKAMRAPESYRRTLFERFPDAPQFAYERALDLRGGKPCGGTRPIFERFLRRVDAEPNVWGPLLRAKLLWLGGVCALEAGEKAEARRLGEKAKAERVREVHDRVIELLDGCD
jgi:hypothetical protein